MLFLDLPVFYVSTSNQYHVVHFQDKEVVTSFDTEQEAHNYVDCAPGCTVVYGEFFEVLKTLV